LSKTYDGVEALKSLTLDVPPKSIFAFLGPNGAGKTTTLKLLLGLTRPSAGNGTIFGKDIVSDSVDIRASVGLPIGSLPLAMVVIALGAACFTALGLAVGGLSPSAQSAPAIVNGIILPLLFISNVFIQIEEGILVTISNLFPVRHFADALQAVYHPDVAGPLDPVDLVWLAGWGLAALLVAWRTFSWEPRG